MNKFKCTKILLTDNVKTLTNNEQAAKNHWNLQTEPDDDSSTPDNKTIVELGIRILNQSKCDVSVCLCFN